MTILSEQNPSYNLILVNLMAVYLKWGPIHYCSSSPLISENSVSVLCRLNSVTNIKPIVELVSTIIFAGAFTDLYVQH
jgi:hypothetical protein